MSSFVPDSHIVCEHCYKFFVAYKVMQMQIDADKRDEITSNAYKGTVNRITCPFCKSEFDYESPVYIYSHTNKFVITSHYPDTLVDVAKFPVAASIAGMGEWKFRKCEYFMDACEKMRIFKNGLDDAKILLLKLEFFEDYKNMDLDSEYITFDHLTDGKLSFTHRNFDGKIKKEYRIDISEYNKLTDIPVKTGDWVTLDRKWAINKTVA